MPRGLPRGYLFQGKPVRQKAGDIHGPEEETVADGARLGPERKPSRSLGIPFQGLGFEAFSGMVCLGCPVEAEAGQGSGPDVPEVLGQHSDLFEAPHQQRRQRGFELDDSDDQENGPRIPQSRAL
jgi:hypothetical protein